MPHWATWNRTIGSSIVMTQWKAPIGWATRMPFIIWRAKRRKPSSNWKITVCHFHGPKRVKSISALSADRATITARVARRIDAVPLPIVPAIHCCTHCMANRWTTIAIILWNILRWILYLRIISVLVCWRFVWKTDPFTGTTTVPSCEVWGMQYTESGCRFRGRTEPVILSNQIFLFPCSADSLTWECNCFTKATEKFSD